MDAVMGEVLIFDRRRAFAEALTALLCQHGIPALYHDAEEHHCLLVSESPDVVILDADDSAAQTLAALAEVREATPTTAVLLLVGDGPPQPAVLEDTGAVAWISRHASADDVLSAVRSALRGGHGVVSAVATPRVVIDMAPPPALAGLTPREREVLQAVAEGLSGPQIARRLSISPNTVRTHGQNVLAKLGVSSRLEAAAIAVEAGLGPRAAARRAG